MCTGAVGSNQRQLVQTTNNAPLQDGTESSAARPLTKAGSFEAPPMQESHDLAPLRVVGETSERLGCSTRLADNLKGRPRRPIADLELIPPVCPFASQRNLQELDAGAEGSSRIWRVRVILFESDTDPMVLLDTRPRCEHLSSTEIKGERSYQDDRGGVSQRQQRGSKRHLDRDEEGRNGPKKSWVRCLADWRNSPQTGAPARVWRKKQTRGLRLPSPRSSLLFFLRLCSSRFSRHQRRPPPAALSLLSLPLRFPRLALAMKLSSSLVVLAFGLSSFTEAATAPNILALRRLMTDQVRLILLSDTAAELTSLRHSASSDLFRTQRFSFPAALVGSQKQISRTDSSLFPCLARAQLEELLGEWSQPLRTSFTPDRPSSSSSKLLLMHPLF